MIFFSLIITFCISSWHKYQQHSLPLLCGRCGKRIKGRQHRSSHERRCKESRKT